MTKAEIVDKVAKATNVEKILVAEIIDEVIVAVKSSVEKGEPVFLRGFGSFIIKNRAAKTARNIKKGTTITIPAHDVPAFKPSKAFSINKK